MSFAKKCKIVVCKIKKCQRNFRKFALKIYFSVSRKLFFDFGVSWTKTKVEGHCNKHSIKTSVAKADMILIFAFCFSKSASASVFSQNAKTEADFKKQNQIKKQAICFLLFIFHTNLSASAFWTCFLLSVSAFFDLLSAKQIKKQKKLLSAFYFSQHR